jgi:hypothetical protein
MGWVVGDYRIERLLDFLYAADFAQDYATDHRTTAEFFLRVEQLAQMSGWRKGSTVTQAATAPAVYFWRATCLTEALFLEGLKQPEVIQFRVRYPWLSGLTWEEADSLAIIAKWPLSIRQDEPDSLEWARREISNVARRFGLEVVHVEDMLSELTILANSLSLRFPWHVEQAALVGMAAMMPSVGMPHMSTSIEASPNDPPWRWRVWVEVDLRGEIEAALTLLRHGQRQYYGAPVADVDAKTWRVFLFVTRHWISAALAGIPQTNWPKRRALWFRWNEQHPTDQYRTEGGFHAAYQRAKAALFGRDAASQL